MNASKEECQEAMRRLERMRHPTAQPDERIDLADLIEQFLRKALSRLPSEQAIEKDRKRKKKHNDAKKRQQLDEGTQSDDVL